MAAAEKAGAAIFGDVGKALGREAGEKAAREIAAKLGRELGAEAGDAAGKTAGGIGAVKVTVLFPICRISFLQQCKCHIESNVIF